MSGSARLVLWRLNTWVNSTLTTVNTSLCTLQAQGPCRPTPPSHPRTHTHYMNPRHRDAGCVPLFEGKRSNVILPRASYPGGVGDGILHTLDSLPAPAFTGLRSPGPHARGRGRRGHTKVAPGTRPEHAAVAGSSIASTQSHKPSFTAAHGSVNGMPSNEVHSKVVCSVPAPPRNTFGAAAVQHDKLGLDRASRLSRSASAGSTPISKQMHRNVACATRPWLWHPPRPHRRRAL